MHSLATICRTRCWGQNRLVLQTAQIGQAWAQNLLDRQYHAGNRCGFRRRPPQRLSRYRRWLSSSQTMKTRTTTPARAAVAPQTPFIPLDKRLPGTSFLLLAMTPRYLLLYRFVDIPMCPQWRKLLNFHTYTLCYNKPVGTNRNAFDTERFCCADLCQIGPNSVGTSDVFLPSK